MGENSPNWAKGINHQNQEAEQNPNRLNPKKSMPRHIIIKLLKTSLSLDKEKTESEKQCFAHSSRMI